MNPLTPISGRRQPKREEASRKLLQMVRRLGPGSQLPTFLELCDSLQVSKGTLDSALASFEQQNIIERRHGIGIFVSSQIRRPLVVLCSTWMLNNSSSIPFWSMLLEQLQMQAEELGYQLIYQNGDDSDATPERYQQIASQVEAQGVQGVINIDCSIFVTEVVSQRGIPLVSFSSYSSCVVDLDRSYALNAGIWQLKRLGCHRVSNWGWVPYPEEEGVQSRHETEVRQAFNLHDLVFYPELMQTFREVDVLSQQMTQDCSHRVLELMQRPSGHLPDGLIFNNDYIARVAIETLKNIDVVLGRDLQIVSFANHGSPVLQEFKEEIIMMEFDTALVAREILEMLQAAMDNKIPSGGHRFVRPLPVVPAALKQMFKAFL